MKKIVWARDKEKILAWAMGVAAMSIVAIGIVVVVMNLRKNSSMGAGEAVDKCLYDSFDETVGCIGDIYQQNNDLDEFVAIYDEVIGKAKERNNYELASKLDVQRAILLVNYGYCDEAIRILDEEDFSGFENEYLAYIYSEAASVALSCNNDEMRNKWTDLMIESQKGVDYEDF